MAYLRLWHVVGVAVSFVRGIIRGRFLVALLDATRKLQEAFFKYLSMPPQKNSVRSSEKWWAQGKRTRCGWKYRNVNEGRRSWAEMVTLRARVLSDFFSAFTAVMSTARSSRSAIAVTRFSTSRVMSSFIFITLFVRPLAFFWLLSHSALDCRRCARRQVSMAQS